MDTTRKRHAAIYLRLSQKSKDEMKLADQEAGCRRLAAEHGYEVVQVYEDDGITGYVAKDRPGWNQLLKDVAEGHLSVIVAQAEDRFARNPDAKERLKDLCAEAGVAWHTKIDGWNDPSTADGEYNSLQRVARARHESRIKSERQKQRNEERRLRGDPPRGGRRPFGYAANGEPHPTEAPLVRWAYAHCLAAEGTGLSAVRTHFNKIGVTSVNGNPFDLPKIEKILRRARNAGLVEHKERGTTWPSLVTVDGEYVRGKWEAIVDEQTYFAVVAKLDDPNRRLHAPRPARHLLSSIATCTCGVKLRSSGRDGDTPIYRCGVHDGAAPKIPGTSHISVPCDKLDDLVSREVVHAMMLASRSALPDPDADRLESLHVALTKNRKGQQQAAQSMLDPDLEHLMQTFKTEAVRLRSAERRLQREIDEIRQANARAALLHDLSITVMQTPGRVSLDDAADLHRRLSQRFASLALDERRALVRAYVDVRVHHGRRLDRRVEITHKIATSLNVEGNAP